MRISPLPSLAVLLLAACASTPDRMPGRYGVVFETRDLADHKQRDVPYQPQIVAALRDRLAAVDVVTSPVSGSYDAVIVVRPGTTFLVDSRPSAPQGTALQDQKGQYVSFSIERDGKAIAKGTTAFDRSGPPEEGSSRQSEDVQRSYRAGIEVARAIVDALREAG